MARGVGKGVVRRPKVWRPGPPAGITPPPAGLSFDTVARRAGRSAKGEPAEYRRGRERNLTPPKNS